MSSKLVPFFGVAALSLLLGAGSALAAPVNSDTDSIHARELRQRGKALMSDKNMDKAGSGMLQPGPYDGPMFNKPGQRDVVRPISQNRYTQNQETDPGWNGTRPKKTVPPRHNYQPAVRDQGMSPAVPVQSSDDGGRKLRPHRDHAPLSPDGWKQTGGDAAPFSYRR
ncbi:MAG: hypothetical protein J1E80_10005 [Desulfovibrionaceae bacterium]|nr:hypothetical protein [Desulfovibrionaceae bacterium]